MLTLTIVSICSHLSDIKTTVCNKYFLLAPLTMSPNDTASHRRACRVDLERKNIHVSDSHVMDID